MDNNIKETELISMDYSHICCFTGHRPERLEMAEGRVIKWLNEQIDQIWHNEFI